MHADSGSNVALAKRVHLSPLPCLARVRKLEAARLIRKYVAPLDAQQLGLHMNGFMSVSLKQQTRAALDSFEAKIRARDEVMECYLMSGDADYLIRVALPDITALERFIIEQLSPMKEIEKIPSSFTLTQVIYKTALPL